MAAAMAVPLPLGMARAGLLPPPLSLLVAGPDGEQISRWGNACALALAANFPGAPNFLTQPDGGLDGVTGANRLDALVVPDGKTAAILPGLALIAWLAGDDRVHFDPTRWVPVMAGSNSGVLVVRSAGGATPKVAPDAAALRAMAPLKLAADQPQSRDLAALLALERMGVATAPVFGLHDTAAKTQAYINGQADAVFLAGEGVAEDIAPLAANGGVALFSLGQIDQNGITQADQRFPALPDAIAYSGVPKSPLDVLYQAAASAARLDFLVVLPKLTEPGAVAQWRAAAAAAIASPGLAAAASASAVGLNNACGLTSELVALTQAQGTQPRLQAFLVQHFGAQAG